MGEGHMTPTFPHALSRPLIRSGLYGNLLLFSLNATHYMQTLYETGGEIVPVSRDRKYVFAFGSEHNQAVLSNTDLFHNHTYEDISYLSRSNSYARELTTGLAFLNGPAHRHRRRQMMPYFHREWSARYVEIMVALTERFIDKWDVGTSLEIYPAIEDLVIQIGLQTLLGLESSTAATRLQDLLEELFEVMYSIKYVLSPYNLPGGPYQRSIEVSKQLSQAMRDLVAEKRAAGLYGDDVLTQLIHLMDSSPDFDMDDLLGTTMGIFRGMYPNAATALVCSLLLLALFPDTAREVLCELQDQLHGNPPANEDLDRLPLLEGVILESMRLLPPVYWIPRIARTPFALGNQEFTAGTNIFLSPYVTHRIPQAYPDPDAFCPRRWIGARQNTYTYIPFSAGPRRCIGATFAMNMMKIVLATILQRYSLSLPDHTRLDFTGIRRPVPRAGTRVRIGRAGGTTQPRGLRGNFGDFVNYNVS
jgi:cytochrome P450